VFLLIVAGKKPAQILGIDELGLISVAALVYAATYSLK
jgi:hypothetical protein